MSEKVYLGDGLYARYDGFQFELYTFDGISTENQVFLDSRVLDSFLKFVERSFNVEIKVTPNEQTQINEEA